MGPAKITTDHEEIRTWVESRGGVPAHVKHTSTEPLGLGVLRIDFPGLDAEETLETLGWDEWFREFDEHGLAFLHEDEADLGEEARFNKIVSRATIGSALREGMREHGPRRGVQRPRPAARRSRV